jgi:hypothetical protein
MTTPVPALWTRKQAADVMRFASPGRFILWGCDIEEDQRGRLIDQVAKSNFHNKSLQGLAAMISSGYNKSKLPNCSA